MAGLYPGTGGSSEEIPRLGPIGKTYYWKELTFVDLNGYYTKTETNSQINSTINPLANRISALETGAVTIDTSYESLEDLEDDLDNLSANKIYLVPSESEDEKDLYNEYILKDDELEQIGSKELNLDDYLKTEDLGSNAYDICTVDCTTAHAGVNGATEDAINIKINFAD